MHPGVFAAKEPERPAVIMGASGTVVTYAELEARSNQVAWLARRCGLGPGDGLAAIMENRPELFDLAWGAQRSGLQFTAVNWHLTADEAGYVVTDSGARMVVVSHQLAGLAAQLGPVLAPGVRRLMIGGTIPGWDAYEDAVGALPPSPVPDECEGDIMLYSSGTTGRPKGIKRPVSGVPLGQHPDIPGHWLRELLGMAEGDVYLSPAPLYHAAPLAWSMSSHRTGATVVVMERFEAEQALRLIEAHRVTHSQWVPTMFVRLLKLPAAARAGLRPEQPALGGARRGALPGPGQAGHDRLVGADPVRVLFDDRGIRRRLDLLRRVAAQAWLGRAAADGRPAHPRRRRGGTAAG